MLGKAIHLDFIASVIVSLVVSANETQAETSENPIENVNEGVTETTMSNISPLLIGVCLAISSVFIAGVSICLW